MGTVLVLLVLVPLLVGLIAAAMAAGAEAPPELEPETPSRAATAIDVGRLAWEHRDRRSDD